MENINYGIDLGTTNSGICKLQDGKAIIYKNPVGFSETLPSVVAFRKSRIVIGEKARELLKTGNPHVFSSFKRKMGTDFTYKISDSEDSKTPVELSSMILKELLSFLPEEKPTAAVITIPASFDTIQSNATQQAGKLAGFQQVVLLQEPIAACLAYANFQNIEHSEEKFWLVYDFGGGTFDVALVKIDERELKVIDHEGNNFLGGVDLDHLVIEKLLVPEIEKVLKEENLYKKMLQKQDAAWSKLYFELLYIAEEIKKELSIKENAIAEIELNGGDYFVEFNISRNDFNQVISAKIEESVVLIEKLLEDNSKTAQDVERIILVGGTTYIPFIRERLQAVFHIKIDNSIDPITSIMVGAAYFAGTKVKEISTDTSVENTFTQKKNSTEFQIINEANTQDEEELLMGISAENFEGFYRIIRKDGGFDTGLISFKKKFSEFVQVLPKQKNDFTVSVYNGKQNLVFEKADISINHGVYSISGQPLPNDICLEVDDNFGNTYLEKIFTKNEILPLKKTIYKTTSKNFLNTQEDKLIINITEGKAGTLPGSNVSIGFLEINSKEIPQNLLKGMDIELKFAMSESRELSVSVYISSIDFEINEIFNPQAKILNKEKFKTDINKIISEIDNELYHAENDEDNYIFYAKLKAIKDELFAVSFMLIEVEDNDTTEQIFQLDERKRRALQSYDQLVRFRDVIAEIDEYKERKNEMDEVLEDASPMQIDFYNKIIKDEKAFLESNEKALIKRKTKELSKLYLSIYYKKDEAYIGLYFSYKSRNPQEYKDQHQLNRLIENGDKALENKAYKELKYIVSEMYSLLIEKPKDPFQEDDGNLGLR
ncbi:Hsp70 family protein [Frigoriflavimonas asaccharolytica]|uniref:Molecular chaperone DnaK n=1 Tax=Frigoriflavimonas asaccharolytica TaxID=2735899 RepID=A0A8J8G9B5_9FLAO|nr:Hsp70 family protein [Frigoriflavimonas asaccharolytica]NRS91645.1 molecular chaperone DnaK [Frigoriflavimonas asaccharolytica]